MPPKLNVTELAKVNDRLDSIQLDATSVYVSSMLGSLPRRVSKSGGPIGFISADAPHGNANPHHAYGNGYPSDNARTFEPGDKTDDYAISGSSINRIHAKMHGPDEVTKLADAQQDVGVSNVARSVFLVDDANVYWIGGGVNAVFSVPRLGGATKKLAHTMAGMGGELAIAGDTIYAINLDGSIETMSTNPPVFDSRVVKISLPAH